MYITVELLKSKGACEEGLEWFKEQFPNGCELNNDTINSIENAPTKFIWWFYNNVQQDKKLYKLCGVHGSEGVNSSNGIHGSYGVSWSNGVNSSNGVSGSSEANSSNGMSRSNGVRGSDGVSRSSGVSWSDGVSGSIGIHRSYGVSESSGILNCQGIYKSLFCSNTTGRFLLFNKQVTEGYIDEIIYTLHTRFIGWKYIFNNKNKSWDIPQAIVDYLKGLPEFDADIFKEITGIEV